MVKIIDSKHPSGMPAMEETIIQFGPLALTVPRADYLELAQAMEGKAAADLAAAHKVYDAYRQSTREVSELIRELRAIFYFDDGDDFVIRRPLEEVDEKRLVAVLEKHGRKLGFE